MFRRLVKRYSEEWTAEGIAGGSGGLNASSEREVAELSLDLEDDGEVGARKLTPTTDLKRTLLPLV